MTGEDDSRSISESKIVTEELQCLSGALAVEEVAQAVFKLKRRKAAGPDRMSTEIFKELNIINMAELTTLLNQWWNSPEDFDPELWQAIVVLIFKKGNTEDLNNYRPISLLNTLYKILAMIIKNRLERGMEVHLQRTQFGFRKNKGTAEANRL